MGVKTLYEYFYKLAYGDKGADKATLVNDCLDVADAAIKANLDALAAKQPLDTGLTSIAALTTAVNKMIYTTALDTYAAASLSAFARTILDDADASTVRTTLGLVIGTNVQAYDAGLSSLAALAYVSDSFIKVTATDTYAIRTIAEVKTDLSLNNVTNDAQIAKSLGTAQGDIIYFTASATPTKLTKGTATQVLTMNAGATAPEWATGGGLANIVEDVTPQLGAHLDTNDFGIAFPATQAPDAGANVLDDYEEGTWTPALKFGGNSVDMTYNIQSGLYTKVGRVVTITGYIVLTAKGTSTGAATITGLPFTSKNDNGAYSVVSLKPVNVTFANAFSGYILKNSSSIVLWEVTEAGSESYIMDTDFANNSNVVLSVTYFTD